MAADSGKGVVFAKNRRAILLGSGYRSFTTLFNLSGTMCSPSPEPGTLEAVEKVAVANRKRPSAAKAGPVFNQLRTYGLKPVPFKNQSFPAASEVRPV